MFKECDFDKEVILMGDYYIDWEDKSGRRSLKRTMDRFNMSQLVNKPTRIIHSSQSKIDLIFFYQ